MHSSPGEYIPESHAVAIDVFNDKCTRQIFVMNNVIRSRIIVRLLISGVLDSPGEYIQGSAVAIDVFNNKCTTGRSYFSLVRHIVWAYY